MDLGRLVFNLPLEYKTSIRKLEKTIKKIVDTESALVFNQTCLKENILPKYTNINTHDPAARADHITVEYRKQLIQRQIFMKTEQLRN